MSRIDYRDISTSARNRYLYPSDRETTLSDVLVPLATYGVFFSGAPKAVGKFIGKRLGVNKVLAGVKARAEAAAAAGQKKGAEIISQSAMAEKRHFGGISNLMKSDSAREALRDAVSSNVKEKTSSIYEGFIGKYGSKITGATDFAGRGARSAGDYLKSKVPQARNIFNSALRNVGAIAVGGAVFGAATAMNDKSGVRPIATVGMGFPEGTNWVKTGGKGLRPGHLGATGDLVFAMRGAR